MKFIIISMLVFVCSNSVKGQSLPFVDTCIYTRQYEGEWRNINGSDTIKVYFRVQNFFSAITQTIESSMLGWIDYKSSYLTIMSDYSHRYDVLPSDFQQKKNIVFSISLKAEGCVNPITKFNGGFRDTPRNNNHTWRLTRLNDNSIEVKQFLGEGLWSNPPLTGFSLPQTFILTRL